MPYIIDGNNLLGLRLEILIKEPGARGRLVQRLAAFSRVKRTKVVVVFDGEPESGMPGPDVSLGDVRILYAGRKRDADSMILKVLEAADDPAGYVLVTSDRLLGDRARQRGARNVTPSARFTRTLDEIAPAESAGAAPLSPDEVAEWEAWFNKGRG